MINVARGRQNLVQQLIRYSADSQGKNLTERTVSPHLVHLFGRIKGFVYCTDIDK